MVQLRQSANSRSSKHRRSPSAQVLASASANAVQNPMVSRMHGPKPLLHPSRQYSGVVV